MEFIEPFPYIIKYKKGKENFFVDALSRRYALLTTLYAKLISFEYVKDLYEHDSDFAQIFVACERGQGLVREAHGGGLMGHFEVKRTLDILHEHFFWPKMKHDVEKICNRCIARKKAKSKVLPHGLYTPLQVPNEP